MRIHRESPGIVRTRAVSLALALAPLLPLARRMFLVLVLVTVMAVTMAGAARAGEPAYNVCETQIRAYLAERFDQTVNRIEFRFQNRSSPTTMFSLSQAIVYPNECPGYHFFELNVDAYSCERQAHYGKTPNYLQYRSSGDGC